MNVKTNAKTLTLLTTSILALVTAGSAATITLTSDSFESSLGNWETVAFGPNPNDVTQYSYTGSPAVNYATTGNGAALVIGRSDAMILSATLDLSQFDDITISFDVKFIQGSTTRRGELSYSDNGGTSWTSLGQWDTSEIVAFNGGAPYVYEDGVSGMSSSVTLTNGTAGGTYSAGTGQNINGYDGSVFTNNTLFRFNHNGDNTGRQMYLDNVVISGNSPIPEPSVAAMLGLAGLALLRRRRA